MAAGVPIAFQEVLNVSSLINVIRKIFFGGGAGTREGSNDRLVGGVWREGPAD